MLPIVHIVISRRENDCAICALAMLTGKDYEDVLLAVDKVDSKAGRKGLWATQIKKAAQKLGCHLTAKKTYDIETATGILNISCPALRNDHAVLLRNGMIFDCDGTVWEADDYVEGNGVELGSLLTLAESS